MIPKLIKLTRVHGPVVKNAATGVSYIDVKLESTVRISPLMIAFVMPCSASENMEPTPFTLVGIAGSTFTIRETPEEIMALIESACSSDS